MANELQTPVITGDQVRAVIGQTMLTIETGGATIEDVESVSKLADSWCKMIQVQINAVKMELECKKNGHNFGAAMNRAKRLVQDGYLDDEAAP